MEIDLELYRIFISVCEHSNITKAASDLYISQPAVTQAVKRLEEQLNVTLFIRTKRGVILTEEGNTLYQNVKGAFDLIKNGENKLSQLKTLDSGTFSIGINTTLTKEFLLPYLKRFHESYPKIIINISKGPSYELLNLLRNGHIDLMIVNLPFKNDSDIQIIPCKKVHDVFAAPKELKHLADHEIVLSDLNKYHLILQSKASTARTFLDSWAYKNNVILKPVMECDSYTLVYEFAKIGMGIGYVTREYILDDLKENILFELKVTPKIPEREIGIIVKKDIAPRYITQKFIELLTKN